MIWDDPWGASANDYDLYVWRLDTLDIVDYSTNVQNGDDDPSESISFTPQSGVSYGFRIRKAVAFQKIFMLLKFPIKVSRRDAQ